MDGPNAWSGRLEFCHSAVWGTICDVGWGWDDARVACRQLGYPAGGEAIPGGWFPSAPSSRPIHLGNVSCVGSEKQLVACRLPLSLPRICYTNQGTWDHRADAGLACVPNDTATAGPAPPAAGFTSGSNSWAPGDYPCSNEGALRLAPATMTSGGALAWVGGRLEVCYNGQWGR